jgi:hypothetical protein
MNEKQLIADLYEQLSLWMKASKKKNKKEHYAETTKTLERAEKFLNQK